MASSTSSSNFLDLPAELLGEISSYLDRPTFLASVCKDLSKIINSTPSLWSYVSFRKREHSAEDVLFFRKHLERGKSCPLHVSIRAIGSPEMATKSGMWSTLSIHRGRICSLVIKTDTLVLSGTILFKVLLSLPVISPHLSLRKLDVRHSENLNTLLATMPQHPMYPHILLEPIPSIFPSLTTLHLAHLDLCVPNISAPLLSLETLILDGSMSWSCDSAGLYRVIQLLEKAPRLETLWLKDHQLYTGHDVRPISVLRPDIYSTAPIQCPVVLPRLTRLALTAPGFGIDLLHTIAAPLLQDLHLDALRDEGYFGEEAEWTETYLQMLCASLRLLAVRSPALRRLALLGIYLTRDTWEWLFGCSQGEVPFSLLESIALREIAAEEAGMINFVDNSLLEMYAKIGRIPLRRFAYLASEPLLSGTGLCGLAGLFVQKRADGVFELEVDEETGDGVKEQLSLLPMGMKTIFHKGPFRRKEWWKLGQDIDPTERDSY